MTSSLYRVGPSLIVATPQRRSLRQWADHEAAVEVQGGDHQAVAACETHVARLTGAPPEVFASAKKAQSTPDSRGKWAP